MTDDERVGLGAIVAAASRGEGLDAAVEWIRRQLEIDARRRSPRGRYRSLRRVVL